VLPPFAMGVLGKLQLAYALFATAGSEDVKTVIKVPGWPDISGKVPLSTGFISHGQIFISGMSGMDMTSFKPVLGGVGPETNQTLHNIKMVMEAAGSDMDHVVGCQVFLADIKDFMAVNAVYAQFFQKPYPARVAMQVGALAGAAKVEIKCAGVVKDVPKEVVQVPGWPEVDKVPLSRGIVANGHVFASGVMGSDVHTGKIAEGGIQAETKQALSNMKEIMEAGGSSMADVVDCAVYLVDMKDFVAMNEAYIAFFPSPKPARIAGQLVSALAGPAKVEIQCFGALASSERKQLVVPGWPDVGAFPLSWGIESGGILHLSGMSGVNFSTGKMVPGGVVAETYATLAHIHRAARAGGSSMANLLDCAVFLADLKDFAVMNKAYAAFFPSAPPARVCTQTGGPLAGNASLEIMCTAALPARTAGQENLIV